MGAFFGGIYIAIAAALITFVISLGMSSPNRRSKNSRTM
jgi:hypothetical protein